jgi:hypothetical protein
MRYVLTVGVDEDGPMVADDDGDVLIFSNSAIASEMAKRLVKGENGLEPLPDGFGVFVQKLKATAFYFPVKNPAKPEAAPYVDETEVVPDPDKESDDGRN